MHKPILRRVGIVLLLVNLLELAWTAYLASSSHRFYFDFTFLGAGICLLFGSLKTARFIRGFAALGLVGAGLGFLALVGYALYWIATEPISSAMAELQAATLDAEDSIRAVVWVVMCAWTFRALSHPEVLADGQKPVPQQQPATSPGQPIRYRRARASL